MRALYIPLSIVMLTTSCVAKRKYTDALDREQALLARNNELTTRVSDLDGQLQALQTDIGNLRQKVGQLEGDNAKLISDLDLTASQLVEARRKNNLTSEELTSERQRLAEMSRILDQQRGAMENLRNTIQQALRGFSSNELQVFTKNGRVYVSLQESLLFPSGSAVVNTKGKEALSTLSQALHASPDINVVVEGHTDSIPIRGKYEDNWDLSVARSTAIVRLLTDAYKLDPMRVTASGRSRYEPVASNATTDGRARNRRTEIILAPKLDLLMQLLTPTGNTTPAAGNAVGTGM